MLALTLNGQAPALRTDHPEPKLLPGEVLIRPTRMGVCSTDHELAKGYMDFSGVLGHEFVGVVEKTADPADDHWIGQRVVGTINCVCGHCDQCRAGIREHCRNRTVLGILNRDGCFAQAFTLPAQNLLAVPDNVDDDHAVFVEPLAAAYQVLRQITVINRPYITVLGDGRLGLLVAQVLSKLNATVRCVGKHPDKLKLCEKWGIKSRLLKDVGLRQDQDIVVDCSGNAQGFQTAVNMVRPRGTIVLKTTVAPPAPEAPPPPEGTPPPERSPGGPREGTQVKPASHAGSGFAGVDLAPVVINEINVVGSRCGPFDQALHGLSAGEIDVVSLISRRHRLIDAEQALKTAQQPGVIKVLLEP